MRKIEEIRTYTNDREREKGKGNKRREVEGWKEGRERGNKKKKIPSNFSFS